MSKRYNIKWRANDNKLLANALRSRNAKIDRLLKKYDDEEKFHDPVRRYIYKLSVPEKIKLSDLKKEIHTRKDFNKYVKEFRSFSARGGEKDLPLPGGFERIKMTPGRIKTIDRNLKKFNKIITDLEKTLPKELRSALPNRITRKQFLEWIDTKADYDRELASIKSFFKKGLQKIVDVPIPNSKLKITLWQLEQTESRLEFINKNRSERLAELLSTEVHDRGKGLGYKIGDIGMGKVELRSLESLTGFNASMDRSSLMKRFNQIIKESRDMYWDMREIVLKENYISALTNEFNDFPEMKKIIDHIKNMDYKEFRKTFEANDHSFELPYSADDSEKQAHFESIKSIWMPNTKPQTEG